MREAVFKAVEGGYKMPTWYFIENLPSYAFCQFWLDPLFWQCLGKALGWSGKVDMKFINAFGNTFVIEQIERWEMHQHKFVHHLADGKDIDTFFKDLLS